MYSLRRSSSLIASSIYPFDYFFSFAFKSSAFAIMVVL